MPSIGLMPTSPQPAIAVPADEPMPTVPSLGLMPTSPQLMPAVPSSQPLSESQHSFHSSASAAHQRYLIFAMNMERNGYKQYTLALSWELELTYICKILIISAQQD